MASKELIGVKAVATEAGTFWAVTFDFCMLGDSKLHDCRQRAIAEAQAIVRSDPEYRQMDIV